MIFSIRTRLTLWYTGLLGASLVVFAFILYFSLNKVYTDKIDEQINSVSGMMVHTVIGPSGRLIVPHNFEVILERFFGIKTSGNYIQVLTAHGMVVAKSSSLEGFILPLTENAYERAVEGESTYEIVDTMGRFPVRTITKPVRVGGGLVAIIQVGSSMEVLERIFRYIVYVFLFGGAAVIVISSLGGRAIAKKAFKPVDNITRMARKIEAENLNERLEIKGPHDEIRRLAETFNETIARLEASFNRVKQFTGDASHELKTPLTILKGEIEVALRGSGSPEYMKEVLESALEEIDRMSNIVNNLLDLAKADVEVMVSKKEPVRFDTVVTESFELLKRRAVTKNISMAISNNSSLEVLGDGVRLGQLVFNLIDNGIKYNREDGSLDISLEAEGGDAVLRVSDTGLGIADTELPHIFDRFYRVDKARTRDTGGAGLGLNICTAIVESMGGEIGAESNLGQGTVFTVKIPLLSDKKL